MTAARRTLEADFEAIDSVFADLIARLAPAEHADTLRSTALLLSRERRNGHACIDLARWAGDAADQSIDAEVAVVAARSFPTLDAWRTALDASGLASDGREATPFVLDESNRCYLARYFHAERRLAVRIRAAVASAGHDDAVSTPARPSDSQFDALFPPPKTLGGGGSDGRNRQADAARLVLARRFAIVSGGPGTGKTTTVARILALLLAGEARLRIELAAPTGKAAARLTESLRSQAARLPVDSSTRDRVGALEARTLHRLLGYRGASRGFHHDEAHPLSCDVVIVDEASMIDLLLMDALLAAVPPHACVVLVGDANQLASVEAGFVFGDLCDAAKDPSCTVMRGSAVELDVNWRFADRPGIAALADAVRDGAADEAIAVLGNETLVDALRLERPRDAIDVVTHVEPELVALLEASTPRAALDALACFRLLTATYRGTYGVDALNRLVEARLRGLGAIDDSDWYRGRPVMITVNDYAADLYNGDIGVCFPDAGGRPCIWFPGAGGELRSFFPAKLPSHVTAWAMTVHKSQGSEFDRVFFVLPDEDSPLVSRELVYTAVTRARDTVTLFGSLDTLRAAIVRRAHRTSGLRPALEKGDRPREVVGYGQPPMPGV